MKETQITSTLKEILDQFKAYNEKFQQEAQALLKTAFKEFFATNPAIKAVIWNQYSPYFNDGDECVFSVNMPIFTNAEDEDIEDCRWEDYEGDKEDIFVLSEYDDEIGGEGWNKNSIDEISAIIQSNEMENVFHVMFGNHARVVATIDGFDVEVLDHD